MLRRLLDHDAMGPTEVAAQSNSRIAERISPDPWREALRSARLVMDGGEPRLRPVPRHDAAGLRRGNPTWLPAKQLCPLTQSILSSLAFMIVLYLCHGGLSYVDIGCPAQMINIYLTHDFTSSFRPGTTTICRCLSMRSVSRARTNGLSGAVGMSWGTFVTVSVVGTSNKFR